MKVSRLYQASTAGFSSLHVLRGGSTAQDADAAAGSRAQMRRQPLPPVGAGEGPVAQREAEHSPKSAPLDPVQGGPGLGQDLTSGPTWPPGAADLAGPANPLADALPETVGSLPSEVIPGIIGGVVGGLGGVLGGLAGAGQKALQGMETGGRADDERPGPASAGR